MPKCCLFAAASSAYERHTNKVNSRVDDFTLWQLVGASTLLLKAGGRGESKAPVPGLGFPPQDRIARLNRQALSTSYFPPLSGIGEARAVPVVVDPGPRQASVEHRHEQQDDAHADQDECRVVQSRAVNGAAVYHADEDRRGD